MESGSYSVVWLRLYKMYVRPHLEYAVQAWSPWTQHDIKVLEDVQRRAVRMISGLRAQSYEDKLYELDLMSLEDRRIRGDLIQTWKILHGVDNVSEGTWFTRLHSTSVRDTRASSSPYTLVQNLANSELRRNMFSYRVVRSWNSLPLKVQSSVSINAFKNNYDVWFKSNRLPQL